MSAGRRFRRQVAQHRELVYVGLEIDEGMPAELKEGIVRQRLTVMRGRCPCGATATLPKPPGGSITVEHVEHERGCPAVTTEVRRRYSEWAGR